MTNIAEIFDIKGRFLRSAHLERDFRDPSALYGYILTPGIRDSIERLASGLDPRSGQRAWRITGDYGSGKSSFALLLAHLFSGQAAELPATIKRVVKVERFTTRTRLLPVLITGSREPLSLALIRGFKQALATLPKSPKLQKTINKLAGIAESKPSEIDGAILGLIPRLVSQATESGATTGLLIILDELGKFLEFAALHPERQDLLILQQLAELSARSGETPVFTVGLLHQGFNAYSDQLSQASQREWEKVAGRFEELLFDQPLDQITHLIANALNVRPGLTPKGWETRSTKLMRHTLGLGGSALAPRALHWSTFRRRFILFILLSFPFSSAYLVASDRTSGPCLAFYFPMSRSVSRLLASNRLR